VDDFGGERYGPTSMGRGEVCIVDDDESVREALESLLRSIGLRPVAFESAEDFLQSPYPGTAGCLILDLMMPGMDGRELHQQLLGRGYGIPIIFLTAHSNDEDRGRAMEAGAVAFLPKPVDGDVLLGAVASALDKRVAEGERGS
jgi:FixJ family two-component response regulator